MTKDHRLKADYVQHHPTKRSATLMRRSVKRPSHKSPRQIIPKSETIISQSAKIYSHQIASRVERANEIKRCSKISHFSDLPTDQLIKQSLTPVATSANVQPQTVAPQPATNPFDEFLNQAIQKAESHNQPAPKVTTKWHSKLFRSLSPAS